MAEISITIKSANMDSEVITIERAANITDLKLKIEDAVNATKAAIEEGITDPNMSGPVFTEITEEEFLSAKSKLIN